MEVDANKVIEKLLMEIANTKLENVMLQIKIDDIKKELDKCEVKKAE